MRTSSIHILTVAGLLALAGCSSTTPKESAPAKSSTTPAPAATSPAVISTTNTVQSAVVNLAPASGSLVSGKLTLSPHDGAIMVMGEIGGLKPNQEHAFHIHEKGDCSAADATSAGGHFNPTSQPHGRASAGQHHLGDNDNLKADAKGVVKVHTHFNGVVLNPGAANNIIGKAVIVHAAPDDYTTQPTGNAGGRIACGVIQ